MATSGHPFATALADHRERILETWIEAQARDSRIRTELIDKDELARQSKRLLDALEHALRANGSTADVESSEFSEVRSVLEEMSRQRERLGMRASGTALSILTLKNHVLPHLLHADGAGSEQIEEEFAAVSRLTDTLALAAYEAVVDRRETTITQQSEELLEISTPVFPVWDGVVAAPLIGMLDSDRTQRFMERLLERIVETNSPVALVDITGVPAIDTQTAQHLIDTINAVKLLGSQVILTGVRPSIAQTLVHLGINLEGVRTRATFAAGLRVAMELLDLEVASPDRSHSEA